MSSAADRIKANAERLRTKAPAKTAPADDGLSEVAPAPRPAPGGVRQKNVRRTVDLSPSAHRSLDNWQRDTADRLGLARVTGQEVLAALVDRLLADDELAEHIVRAIAAQRS
ncbi:hypothetical protein A5763_16475 [Mycolicibacterium fortuitum]|uniref:hypothetical protein n=1 Tax=Mycobacteriaceae TaxID=1762 RepID=UPI0007EAABF4|nr:MULTISPECIES: hypothetical protein [Mycobacteriaceae]MDV3136777.1 hypothetical protein [Mycobacterium sp. 29Ha]OBB28758.1 hypothetical protein A5763_16475 [Mycolicibacterium fortuitum]